jgi:hypothetical protein
MVLCVALRTFALTLTCITAHDGNPGNNTQSLCFYQPPVLPVAATQYAKDHSRRACCAPADSQAPIPPDTQTPDMRRCLSVSRWL